MTTAAGSESEADRTVLPDWPLRPWLLAGIGSAAGLLIHLVTQGSPHVPWQMALAAFLFFGSIAAAFTIEQGHWKAPAIFALAVGVVMAGLAWRAVRYGEYLPDEQYGFAAGVLASALALPLFQAGLLKRRLATPYADIHYHGWTDAISGAGALAFTGLSWAVLAILSELFHLLKIDLLRDLMDQEWFGWTFSGLAFGAALGTLRNELKVLGTLQNVVMLVLSLLAVPLAAGLVIFLLATAVSGPQVLWEATRSATPVLLACAAGAFLLANAIVRNDDAAMSRSRVMQGAALVLAAVILPLAVFAAVSMGLRLGQHGLSPERLWGLAAIVVACICGVGCWAALLRGRKGGWAARLRQSNFHLALGVCVMALLLALPILDFGAISTRSQVARLESGRVSAEEFDFAALRWDFGEPGRQALARLARGEGEVAENARKAQAQTARVWRGPREEPDERAARIARLQFVGTDDALRKAVQDWLETESWRCASSCTAVDLGADGEGRKRVAFVQGRVVEHYALQPDGSLAPFELREYAQPKQAEGAPPPKVELRPFSGRQIYVDGEPVGEPFE